MNQDDLLSLESTGICATCLAYVVWRMSVEDLVVCEGLFVRRVRNYELQLTEPWPSSPCDDPTRLRLTYMQFFGIWATIADREAVEALEACIGDIVSSPLNRFFKDEPSQFVLRKLHCIYPAGDALAIRAGSPCRRPWTRLSDEARCMIRTTEWLQFSASQPKSVVEVYLESDPKAVTVFKKIWSGQI